jgi:hypothetical protein
MLGALSVDSALTVQTTASIARSCSDPLNQVPAKNQAYVPTNFVLLLFVSTYL